MKRRHLLVDRREMGQGVHTGLAMLLAEEMPDPHGGWRQGLEAMTAKLAREMGLMVTGGSTSLTVLWLPVREAGAAALPLTSARRARGQRRPGRGREPARREACAGAGRRAPPHAAATGGVAVIAQRPWQALNAARQVAVPRDEAPPAAVSSTAPMARLRAALDEDAGHPDLRRGDVAAAQQAGTRRLHADDSAPLLAHLAQEPVNCTLLVEGGEGGRATRATVWAPTQSPDIGCAVVARLPRLPRDRVPVHVTALGGGFGRRLEVDDTAQAEQVAAAMRFGAALAAQGRLLALAALAAGRWTSGVRRTIRT